MKVGVLIGKGENLYRGLYGGFKRLIFNLGACVLGKKLCDYQNNGA